MEGWRDHGDVMQVARALPWIVGDVDVAVMDVVAPDAADEMRDGVGHGVDMARSAGDRLRQHIAFDVIHACRQVARLAHRG